jgi:hypothetical protein
VRTTWARVLPISDEAARLFYGKLVEIDPSTEPLFATANMDEQGKKLMQTIDVAVAGSMTWIGSSWPSRTWGVATSITGSGRSNTRAL